MPETSWFEEASEEGPVKATARKSTGGKAPRDWSSITLDPYNLGPFASITFKYRSKKFLEDFSDKLQSPSPESAQEDDAKPALDPSPSDEDDAKVERDVVKEVAKISWEELEGLGSLRRRRPVHTR